MDLSGAQKRHLQFVANESAVTRIQDRGFDQGAGGCFWPDRLVEWVSTRSPGASVVAKGIAHHEHRARYDNTTAAPKSRPTVAYPFPYLLSPPPRRQSFSPNVGPESKKTEKIPTERQKSTDDVN